MTKTVMLDGRRKASAKQGDDVTLARFVKTPGEADTRPRQLALDTRHPAYMDGRSLFHNKQVKKPETLRNLMVSGHSNMKIGRDVRKGKFRGYWIYTLSLEERATCPRSCHHWSDCVLPDAKVLMGDLSWRRAADIRAGDRVAGFDEKATPTGHRKTRIAEVESVEIHPRPCVEVITDQGPLVTSEGHLWLTKRDRTGFAWRRAEDVRIGDLTPFFARPWETATSYEAGRLRGFMEGEGHCVLTNNQGFKRNSVGWGQKPTQLMQEIIDIATTLGFGVSRSERISGVNKTAISLAEITGGWRETARFIGMLRPTRLVEKAELLWSDQWLAGRGARHAKVTDVRPVGSQTVVAIKTSTRTMVVDGFFTHNCYGNHMPWAKRVDHTTDDFLPRLEQEIEDLLAVRGRAGILVRLHALGDFYSVDYVRFWRMLLMRHKRLAVYGYTARDVDSDIGWAIRGLAADFRERAMIRFSNAAWPLMATVPITRPEQCPPNAFVCPEQTGRTQACATCAACWGTPKNVAFIAH